jgi:hypothetical protein
MILQEFLDENYSKEEQIALTDLDCSRSGITSLKGIENLVNLKYLYCSNNNLTSLEGIENLVNLKMLNCYGNPLPYSDLKDFNKIILQVKKEVRQTKIEKLLLNN